MAAMWVMIRGEKVMYQKSIFINRKGAKAPFCSPKMGERRKERKELKWKYLVVP